MLVESKFLSFPLCYKKEVSWLTMQIGIIPDKTLPMMMHFCYKTYFRQFYQECTKFKHVSYFSETFHRNLKKFTLKLIDCHLCGHS